MTASTASGHASPVGAGWASSAGWTRLQEGLPGGPRLLQQLPFDGAGAGAETAAAAAAMDDGSDGEEPDSCRPPGTVRTPAWLKERERKYGGGADGWR